MGYITQMTIRMGLYEHGASDKEIAQREGITIGAARSWRVKRGLPTNLNGCASRRGGEPRPGAWRAFIIKNTVGLKNG